MIDPAASQAATLADLEVIGRSWPTGSRAQRHRRRIVERHLPRVFQLAGRCAQRYGVPVEDLVSEGVLGIYRAIDKYEEGHNASFSTYASWWINAFCQQGARCILSPVSRGCGTQWRLVPVVTDGVAVLAAPATDPGVAMDAGRIMNRLRVQEPRLADVLEWRYVDGLECGEIGARIGVSKQRAHQLIVQAEVMARHMGRMRRWPSVDKRT